MVRVTEGKETSTHQGQRARLQEQHAHEEVLGVRGARHRHGPPAEGGQVGPPEWRGAPHQVHLRQPVQALSRSTSGAACGGAHASHMEHLQATRWKHVLGGEYCYMICC